MSWVHGNGYADEVVLVAYALVEEELFYAQSGCLEGKVYRPERRTSSVANSGGAVASDAVCLSAGGPRSASATGPHDL